MNPATKKPKQKEKKISVSQMIVFIVVLSFYAFGKLEGGSSRMRPRNHQINITLYSIFVV